MINIGSKIGERYEIIGNIGSGGMANVYLARDLILNREVAIKVLRFDFQNDHDAIRRFQREALAATEMVHPNIVSVYDVGEENGMQYIVMEYVKGTDLKQYIKHHSPIPLHTVVKMMEQVLSAISVAHQHRIIHRDLKPQNILVDEDGTVKITDFGIAIALSETSLTQTNTLLGSVHYLSPEQARGGMATRQSDIYALGIILYEMLTGVVPFEGESAVSIALKHFQKEMPSVRQMNSTIPQSLENVVLHATAKEIADRYATVDEMYADLSTCLDSERLHEPIYEPTAMFDETIMLEPVKEPDVPVVANQNKVTEHPMYEEDDEEEYEPKKKKSKKIFWVILSILVVLGLVGGGLYLIGRDNGEIAIPDVSGKSESEAVTILESNKIKVKRDTEEIASDKIEKGLVVKTSPPIGTKVKKDAEVVLYISSGQNTVTMKNVRGMTASEAEQELINLGFKKEDITIKEEYSESEDTGLVFKQSPSADKEVIPDETPVTLTVSKGKEDFGLENLYGYTQSQVIRYIDGAGLYLTELSEYNDTVPQGQVIYTTPNGGTPVKKGDTVQVIFSAGPDPKKQSTTPSSSETSTPTESSSKPEPTEPTTSSEAPTEQGKDGEANS